MASASGPSASQMIHPSFTTPCSCSLSTRVRHRAWLGVTVLNVRHANWAWISLATVGLADLYVRLASAGVFTDPRIF